MYIFKYTLFPTILY